MDESTIASYVLENVEPLPDPVFGPRYRVAATLKDGLYLPCVIISSKAFRLNLARKRFADTKMEESILSNFICSGNRLNYYDIATLAISPFAIPLSKLKNMGGETAMGWTQFYVTMDDDNEFSCGTAFNVEFFSMPEGYTAKNVKTIRPARRGDPIAKDLNREKPFFECFINGIG